MVLYYLPILDFHDLKNFVTVAAATGAVGEDDLTNDRLTNLRTVASGYGPLIYLKKEGTGLIELSRVCQVLWNELKTHPNLAKLLVSCFSAHNLLCKKV